MRIVVWLAILCLVFVIQFRQWIWGRDIHINLSSNIHSMDAEVTFAEGMAFVAFRHQLEPIVTEAQKKLTDEFVISLEEAVISCNEKFLDAYAEGKVLHEERFLDPRLKRYVAENPNWWQLRPDRITITVGKATELQRKQSLVWLMLQSSSCPNPEKIVKILAEKMGQDLNQPWNYRQTPLIAALAQGKENIALALIRNPGVRVETKDGFNLTAKDYALANSAQTAASLLP